jgi:hypothetical protein
MACRVVKYFPGYQAPEDISGTDSLPKDACVIFRGTLPLMRHIQATRPWNPGGWCNFRNLACSTYYAHFGAYLLNRDYALLPSAEAVRLVDRLFARYAHGGVVFVRPDSVDKSFKGGLMDDESFADAISRSIYDTAALSLVAKPRQISREWRLIIASGRVIAGSQYFVHGEPSVSTDCPSEVVAFANDTLDQVRWRPDPLFVMDVCDSEDGLRLVELNSFSCSGHYLADVEIVVRVASELASRLAG